MKNPKWGILSAALVLASTSTIVAQNAPQAVNIPNDVIQAIAKKGAGDEIIRMINAGPTNLGVAVLQYKKGARAEVSGIEHSDVAEVYYVLHGEGTMITGGTIENGKQVPAESAAAKVAGPTTTGPAKGTVSRKIGPGDVIIVPVNTPHYTVDVTSDIAFLIVRVDPHKVMELK